MHSCTAAIKVFWREIFNRNVYGAKMLFIFKALCQFRYSKLHRNAGRFWLCLLYSPGVSWCLCLRFCSYLLWSEQKKMTLLGFFWLFFFFFNFLIEKYFLWFQWKTEIGLLWHVQLFGGGEENNKKKHDYMELMTRNNKFLFLLPVGLGPLCPIPEGGFVPAYKWWELSGKPPGGCWSQSGV